MSPARPRATCSSLDTLLTAGTLGSLSDGELLDHFRRDAGSAGQEAFRILVERHGAMVLGVCRSQVKDSHEAEDAFQATFLVLVRRADSIRRRETIGPWLYGVASRVAGGPGSAPTVGKNGRYRWRSILRRGRSPASSTRRRTGCSTTRSGTSPNRSAPR